jgi:hypothetical protein
MRSGESGWQTMVFYQWCFWALWDFWFVADSYGCGGGGVVAECEMSAVARKAAASKIVRAIGIEVMHKQAFTHDGHFDSEWRSEEQLFANGVVGGQASLDDRQWSFISGAFGHIWDFWRCLFVHVPGGTILGVFVYVLKYCNFAILR